MADKVVEYDVIVCGGGPVGLAAALECAKKGKSVLVLERFSLFNYSGSSGDLVRMFRLMYTEDYLADLALEAQKHWHALEAEANEKLILTTGLLNFGDPNYGAGGPEGTLMDPIKNMDRLKLRYEKLNKEEIQEKYPFKDLDEGYLGIYQPDCGCINVPALLRALHKLGKHHGVTYKENAKVVDLDACNQGVQVSYEHGDSTSYVLGAKTILATGAYSNHVLRPLGVQLDLQIWEMVYEYYSTQPTENALFPSMWFQFAADNEDGTSNLFYGFPTVPWGPPDVARIAVDAATRIIKDPSERRVGPSEEDLQNTQNFVRRHLVGVNLVPNLAGTCLQTNVHDNNFVLDFVPKTNNKVVIFCAGWAMKFVPLLGVILQQLALEGHTDHDISHFKISRPGVIKEAEGTIQEGMLGAPDSRPVKYTGSAMPKY